MEIFNKDEKSLEFCEFVHSKEYIESSEFLGRFVKFELFKTSSYFEKNKFCFHLSQPNEIWMIDREININKTFEFNSHIKEKSLNTLVNHKEFSIGIKFTLSLSVIRELGFIPNKYLFIILNEAIINNLAPSYLNWIKFDEAMVNFESKPEMKVGELVVDLIELGFTYNYESLDKESNILFKEDISFFMINDIDQFEGKVKQDWKWGNLFIDTISVDNTFNLKLMLESSLSKTLDFPHGNSLISMAVNYNADNCLDLLLNSGISLWRNPSCSYVTEELHQTVFLRILREKKEPSFAWYQFFMEHMKKEVLSARNKGFEIPFLRRKTETLIFHLTMQQHLNQKFMNQYFINFIYDVLEPVEAAMCVVSNFYLNSDTDKLFKDALEKLEIKNIREIVSENFNILFLKKLLINKRIFSNDIVINGKDFKQLIYQHFNSTLNPNTVRELISLIHN